MKVYIGSKGDMSVGISGWGCDVDFPDVKASDLEDREDFRKDFHAFVSKHLGDIDAVLFDDECPNCRRIGYNQDTMTCVNPHCIMNYREGD